MKRFLALLALLALPPTVEGATATMQSLTAAAAVTADDIFWMVNDPLGVPADRKITAENIRAYMTNGLAVASTVPPPAVVGNTLHVEEHGDDGTGTGSVDFPFRTLTAALTAKAVGDIIQMGPGTFTLTQGAAYDTVNNPLWLTNYLTIEGTGPNTIVSFVPFSANAVNWALGNPTNVPLTGVTLKDFTLDLNAGLETWGSGAKVDGIALYGSGHRIENVRIVDQGGNADAESFGVILFDCADVTIRGVNVSSPDSVNSTGIAPGRSQHVNITSCYLDGLNKGVTPFGWLSNSRITDGIYTNITGYGVFTDTPGANIFWNTTIARNKLWKGTGGQVAIYSAAGSWADTEIRDNQTFFWPAGIVLTNASGAATNYSERVYIDRNHVVGTGAACIGIRADGGITNAAVYRNVVWNSATNYVSGSNNHGAGNTGRTGTALTDLPNAVVGDGSALTALNDDNVNFDDADSNWTATTLGAALEELDDANGGAPNQATGKVNWEQLVNVPAGFADGADDGGAGSGTPTFVNGTEVTQGPDFDNTASSGTVTPTTFSVSGTNVTLTIGNASATAAGAVTTGTQTFAGDKTFTGSVTVEGSLILSGSGGGGMDSLQVTNKLTNSVLTAGRLVVVGSDEALSDDDDFKTSGGDTLYATKLTSTDVRVGLGVITNSLNLVNATASRAAVLDANKYVTNAPGAWTSVTLDTTNAVIDLAGSVPGVDRNYYYSLSTSNQVIFSNLVVGAQGTIWINAAGTAQQVAWSGSYDNFSTNDITWDSGTFTITNRGIVAFKVGWGTDATNVMLGLKRK